MLLNYLSDWPKDYGQALDAAVTVEELIAAIEPYQDAAEDALTAAKAMQQSNWETFREGLKAERRGKFAGAEWMEKYGAILLQGQMLKASMIAQQFGVPWGMAFIRILTFESGGIQVVVDDASIHYLQGGKNRLHKCPQTRKRFCCR